MTTETRLERCKAYLAEALLDPINNKFYIEDLKQSIEMFEKSSTNKLIIQSGWIDNDA